jgi:hypothetical protein
MNGFVSQAFNGDNLWIEELAIPLIHSLPNGKFGTHPWMLDGLTLARTMRPRAGQK